MSPILISLLVSLAYYIHYRLICNLLKPMDKKESEIDITATLFNFIKKPTMFLWRFKWAIVLYSWFILAVAYMFIRPNPSSNSEVIIVMSSFFISLVLSVIETMFCITNDGHIVPIIISSVYKGTKSYFQSCIVKREVPVIAKELEWHPFEDEWDECEIEEPKQLEAKDYVTYSWSDTLPKEVEMITKEYPSYDRDGDLVF